MPKREGVGVEEEAAPEVDGLLKEKAMIGDDRVGGSMAVEVEFACYSVCTKYVQSCSIAQRAVRWLEVMLKSQRRSRFG